MGELNLLPERLTRFTKAREKEGKWGADAAQKLGHDSVTQEQNRKIFWRTEIQKYGKIMNRNIMYKNYLT